MNKSKKCVAVLLGGRSTEHEVSLQSSINVIEAIDRRKYDVILIGIDKKGRWMLCDEQNYILNANDPNSICLVPIPYFLAIIPGHDRTQLIHAATGQALPAIDVVFSVLHGACGENGSVQGLLQMLNIPFVGPDLLSSAICMNKDMTKLVLRDVGISVTPSVTLLREDSAMIDFDAIVTSLGLPLFIKPTSQGSSLGVSKVNDCTGFNQAIMLAFSYDAKVLVEQAISGREIETAVLGNSNSNIEVSVCGEVLFNDEFYAYNTKYLKNDQTTLDIPAQLDPSLAGTIRNIACKAYLALGCSVMARIDFFLTTDGQILLNEVNTLPGFTSTSMYPKLWEASGLDYFDLIDRLMVLAMARH